LAILVVLFRNLHTINVDDLGTLKGWSRSPRLRTASVGAQARGYGIRTM